MWGGIFDSRGYHFFNPFHSRKHLMKQHLHAYAWFVGFAIATKIFVVPLAKQMGIPYVSDL